MPQIRKTILKLFVLSVALLVMTGCSKSGSGASSSEIHDPDSGHPNAWIDTHGSEYQEDETQCIECHGADFKGGISGVSCYSASFEGVSCHPGGPVAHVLPFTDPLLHGPEAKSDLTQCQTCHSDQPSGGAGSNPRFNVSIGNLTNGCEDCHNINTAHAVPWTTGPVATNHPSAGNLAAACALCHGANLGGPAEGGVGPACSDCHTAGSPVTSTNCTSCHGEPPVDCDEATGTCS